MVQFDFNNLLQAQQAVRLPYFMRFEWNFSHAVLATS